MTETQRLKLNELLDNAEPITSDQYKEIEHAALSIATMQLHEKINYAKKLEKQSQWAGAWLVWMNVARQEDADACRLLMDAIAKGNKYREAVKDYINMIDNAKAVSNKFGEDVAKTLYPILKEIHEKVYGVLSNQKPDSNEIKS